MGLFKERKGREEDLRKFERVRGLKEIGVYQVLFE